MQDEEQKIFVWPEKMQPDMFFTSPVRTSAEVLVINGALDGQTPVWSAKAAFSALEAKCKHFVVLPKWGHGGVGDERCGGTILKSFLSTPASSDDSVSVSPAVPVAVHASINGSESVTIASKDNQDAYMEGYRAGFTAAATHASRGSSTCAAVEAALTANKYCQPASLDFNHFGIVGEDLLPGLWGPTEKQLQQEAADEFARVEQQAIN